MTAGAGRFKDSVPGLVIALSIALLSFLASYVHPAFDPLVVSIIFGMFVSNLVSDRAMLEPGISLVLKYFLPLGVAAYGAQLRVTGFETAMWPGVLAVFAFTFFVTYMICKGFALERRISFLLAAGLSVCGASAIAIIAPLIDSEREETSTSIISVMIVGIAGMMTYKIMHDFMGLGGGKLSFMIGTTLPMIGHVKVASMGLGETAAALALNFKLMRLSGLVFVIAVALYIRRKSGWGGAPWLLVAAFLALAVLSNLWPPLAAKRPAFEHVSRFCLSSALAAIGLSLDFDALPSRGYGHMAAAALSWCIVALTVYLALSMVG